MTTSSAPKFTTVSIISKNQRWSFRLPASTTVEAVGRHIKQHLLPCTQLLLDGCKVNKLSMIGDLRTGKPVMLHLHDFQAANSLLHEAAVEGNTTTAKKLLADGYDVHARAWDGLSPLLLATANGCSQCARALLAAGADVQATDNTGHSALHLAVLAECTMASTHDCLPFDLYAALFAAGADLMAAEPSGCTAWGAALSMLPIAAIKKLLDSCLAAQSASWSATQQADFASMAVGLAVEAGRADVLELLASERQLGRERLIGLHRIPQEPAEPYTTPHGIRCDCCGVWAQVRVGARRSCSQRPQDLPPLLAASCVDTGCLQALLRLGMPVDSQDSRGRTALHHAVRAGASAPAMVEALLQAGARVDSVDGDGWTALHVAAANGHADVAQQLLAAGADPSRQSTLYIHMEDLTRDQQACLRRSSGPQTLRVLDMHSALQLQGGQPPLWCALKSGNWRVVELLLHSSCSRDWLQANRAALADLARRLGTAELAEQLMAYPASRLHHQRCTLPVPSPSGQTDWALVGEPDAHARLQRAGSGASAASSGSRDARRLRRTSSSGAGGDDDRDGCPVGEAHACTALLDAPRGMKKRAGTKMDFPSDTAEQNWQRVKAQRQAAAAGTLTAAAPPPPSRAPRAATHAPDLSTAQFPALATASPETAAEEGPAGGITEDSSGPRLRNPWQAVARVQAARPVQVLAAATPMDHVAAAPAASPFAAPGSSHEAPAGGSTPRRPPRESPLDMLLRMHSRAASAAVSAPAEDGDMCIPLPSAMSLPDALPMAGGRLADGTASRDVASMLKVSAKEFVPCVAPADGPATTPTPLADGPAITPSPPAPAGPSADGPATDSTAVANPLRYVDPIAALPDEDDWDSHLYGELSECKAKAAVVLEEPAEVAAPREPGATPPAPPKPRRSPHSGSSSPPPGYGLTPPPPPPPPGNPYPAQGQWNGGWAGMGPANGAAGPYGMVPGGYVMSPQGVVAGPGVLPYRMNPMMQPYGPMSPHVMMPQMGGHMHGMPMMNPMYAMNPMYPMINMVNVMAMPGMAAPHGYGNYMAPPIPPPRTPPGTPPLRPMSGKLLHDRNGRPRQVASRPAERHVGGQGEGISLPRTPTGMDVERRGRGTSADHAGGASSGAHTPASSLHPDPLQNMEGDEAPHSPSSECTAGHGEVGEAVAQLVHEVCWKLRVEAEDGDAACDALAAGDAHRPSTTNSESCSSGCASPRRASSHGSADWSGEACEGLLVTDVSLHAGVLPRRDAHPVEQHAAIVV